MNTIESLLAILNVFSCLKGIRICRWKRLYDDFEIEYDSVCKKFEQQELNDLVGYLGLSQFQSFKHHGSMRQNLDEEGSKVFYIQTLS